MTLQDQSSLGNITYISETSVTAIGTDYFVNYLVMQETLDKMCPDKKISFTSIYIYLKGAFEQFRNKNLHEGASHRMRRNTNRSIYDR